MLAYKCWFLNLVYSFEKYITNEESVLQIIEFYHVFRTAEFTLC